VILHERLALRRSSKHDLSRLRSQAHLVVTLAPPSATLASARRAGPASTVRLAICECCLDLLKRSSPSRCRTQTVAQASDGTTPQDVVVDVRACRSRSSASVPRRTPRMTSFLGLPVWSAPMRKRGVLGVADLDGHVHSPPRCSRRSRALPTADRRPVRRRHPARRRSASLWGACAAAWPADASGLPGGRPFTVVAVVLAQPLGGRDSGAAAVLVPPARSSRPAWIAVWPWGVGATWRSR
jgi:hypothetical protein